MVDEAQDGEETVAFGSEWLGVGPFSETVAFSEDTVSGDDSAPKGAFTLRSAAMDSKVQFWFGSKAIEEERMVRDDNVGQQKPLPLREKGSVVVPREWRYRRSGQGKDGGNRQGSHLIFRFACSDDKNVVGGERFDWVFGSASGSTRRMHNEGDAVFRHSE
jgi:hypothetical protein